MSKDKIVTEKRSVSHLFRCLVCHTLRFLRDSDGSASVVDIRAHLEEKHGNDIPSEYRVRNDNGIGKWWGWMRWWAESYEYAGFLRRSKSVWNITQAGLDILEKDDKAIMDAAEFANKAHRQRQKEKAAQAEKAAQTTPEDASNANEPEGNVSDYHDYAYKGISEHIQSMDPFVFQLLIAALLRGMGYYVREVSPRNTADGGIDIIAYQGGDAIGAKTPRVKVQVKRQKSTIGEPELRELLGVMTDGDVGVFISTGGFTRGCRDFAKQQPRQLELIHMSRFIELWRDNYDKLSDEDKSLLPLQPIYFLDEERVKRS